MYLKTRIGHTERWIYFNFLHSYSKFVTGLKQCYKIKLMTLLVLLLCQLGPCCV